MEQPNADRNLLFGVLALQMDFINRDQLVAAMQAWVADKSKSLGEVLRRQGALAEDTYTLLDALVQKHLAMHGDDAEKSLATLSSVTSIRQDLAKVADADVQASLSHVGSATAGGATVGGAAKAEADPYATLAPEKTVASVAPASARMSPGTSAGTSPGTAGAGQAAEADPHKTTGFVSSTGATGATGSTGSVGASSSVSFGALGGGGVRFRVLRPHARGGLGEVLVARDAELPREVALKQIQDRHADDAGSKARFMLEAEITGGLEHPGIVPVYGLGTYADGRPFYAMRFIRGDSLKEALERFHKMKNEMPDAERALQFRDMLRRFVDVCNAIAYAHSRSVLHRDLKPGNIMLGKYGETLVVDWGLAKVMGTASHPAPAGPGEGSLTTSGSSAAETVAGSALGTPQYMSPEQAAGRLDQLGPASDVYSLGATLYCVLTGKPPVTDRDVGAVLQKVQRGEFPRPREVDKDIAAPLEAICLKAMALVPQERYSSPQDLADDIEHWLADERVSAWPEPWTVTARRWISRHRTLVTGLATFIVVATVGLSVATVLLTAANEREREARALAEKEEREARRQQQIAEKNFKLARTAVDRYHTDVSESVLLHEPGMEPLRKKLLEAAREFYEKFVKERGKDPGVKGELGKAIFRLAQITGDIGSETKAIKLHEQAAELLGQLASKPDGSEFKPDLAACFHHLGRLYRLTDQVDKSEQSYQKALTSWKELLKEQPKSDRYLAKLAKSQYGLGNLYQLTRRLDKAREMYRQALDHLRVLAKAHPEVDEYQRDLAVDLNNLAMVYRSTGKDLEALQAWEQAETIQKKLVADQPTISQYQIDLARSSFNLGGLYARTGKPGPAAAAYEEAAKLGQALTDRHPAVNSFQINRAEALTALANVYRRNGDLAQAEEACRQALAIKQKLAARYQDTPSYQGDLARGYVALADVLRARKQPDKAEQAFAAAIKIQEKLASEQPLVPPYEAELAIGYNSLGLLYAESNNEEKAAASYNKALSLWASLSKKHPRDVQYARGLAQTCVNLGNLAATHSRQAQALPWYDRALEKAPTLADKLRIRLQRVLPLARSGKYQEAAAEAEVLAGKARAGAPLYRLARAFAVSAKAAAADVKLADAERRRLADQYAGQAMKLLAAAGKAGFFKAQANLEKLKSDPDLEILRTRAEFKTFVKASEAESTSLRTLPILDLTHPPTRVSIQTLPHLTANRVVPA